MSVASGQKSAQGVHLLRPFPVLSEKGMWSMFIGGTHTHVTRRGTEAVLLPQTIAYFSTAEPLTDILIPKVAYGTLFTSVESWYCTENRIGADFKVEHRLDGQMLILQTESNAVIRAYRTMRIAEELLVAGFDIKFALSYAELLGADSMPFLVSEEYLDRLPPRERNSDSMKKALSFQALFDRLFHRDGQVAPARELPKDYKGNEIKPGTRTTMVLARTGLDDENFSYLLSYLNGF